MGLSTEKEKELDKQLIELAMSDFEYFCKITSADKEQAYLCMAKQAGKSHQQIANQLGISKQAVAKRWQKCKPIVDESN
jgi:hypothetical protein